MLREAPEPPFPDEAREAGLTEGVVVLRVTVDAEGQVSAAEVVEPQCHGFDEAARQAALGHRFEPAQRDGKPVAVRILLRIEFRLPPPPAEPPPPAPPPAASPSAVKPPPSKQPEVVDVTVRYRSDAERLRRSAEAVQVVETEEAKRQSADLGEVVARTQGVRVQRAGGLGSDTRFSLNGLTDDQIRFFLDGVPLELAGYPFGMSNVPVNLVERVEIYRGVVPIRFGADALGGAVNLVSDRDVWGTHASASYQIGSFGTERLTLSAEHLDEATGYYARFGGFLDRADNDYPMNIEVPDERGREVPARVHRFHDAYSAEGANIEAGVVDQPWADRLAVRAFVTHYEKEIQHNLVMTFSPYGDVTLSELSAGATLRYEHALDQQWSLNAIAGYAYRSQTYVDVGECVYDWFGQCVRERGQPGERVGRAQDQRYGEDTTYARLNLEWKVRPDHALRASLSPTSTERTGDERREANPEARDPLSAERRLFAFVTGVEYEVDLFDERLESILFVKDYLQLLRSEDPLSNGTLRREDRETHRVGLGDSLRYFFAEWLYAKASYEWATRLPRADEIFGNAFPVQPNLGLEPELSHNLNIGLTLDAPIGAAGALRGDVNGFARDADQLIVLVGDEQTATYQNVYSARSLGVEAAAGWTSPGEFLELDANLTYVDFRNTSSTGAFEKYEGQRIPNRPYLMSNGSARVQVREVAAPRDELALVWSTRYVHEFFRGWEGLGTNKLTVDSQLLHNVALTYLVRKAATELTFTGEVQNVTDQAAYDFFGVPRPGRAFYFKATASL
jgi:TonB family protein